MAMILRLQNEKSSSEIEAKQYRQLAEQKQEFHLEMIESLQWDIIKLEHERSEMEENLRMHREKLEAACEEMSYLRSTMEGGIKDVPNLSLDNMDSSVL
uniref:GTD-binding domain-containing protein n=1 Tax=Salix viminalis TaxID=40686 RepID=A0A6N2L3G8_SALVM